MRAMQLRRAVAADAGLVRELVRAAYAKWVPLIGREPRPMGASYDDAIARHVIDLCEVGAQVVALIELVPEPACLLVENIAVLPQQQGQGIGDALLEHAEEVARSLQLPALRLYTNAAFASNIAFYARRGFVEVRREPLAAGGELVHMERQLR
jgi:N-acetylglutamate synthase-like GNAT family acetyltransferase